MSKYLNEDSQSFKDFFKKDFFKTLKGMVVILIAGALLAAGIGIGIGRVTKACFQDLSVELGTQSVSITRFMTRHANINKVSFVSDPGVIDLSRVGETEVTLRHGNQVETVTFRVVDTTAPEVEFETLLVREEGYVPAPRDFIKSISDEDTTTVSFAENVAVPADFSDTPCTVVVTDASGNATTGECVLRFGNYRTEVTKEYGLPVTKDDILLCVERDGDAVDQARLDQINKSQPGIYNVTVNFDGVEDICKVKIQDTTGPVLVVRDVSIEPEEEIQILDFVVSVSDNSGGVRVSLATPLDNRKEEVQRAVIQAEDAYGNITTAEATLRVTEDEDGPKINFAHDYVQALCGGTSPNYMEGVTVYDEVDGPCMVVYDDSDVNLEEIGTYKVVYTAKDKSGNTTTREREVVVTFDYSSENLSSDAKMYIQYAAASLSSDPEEIRDYVRDSFKYNSNWGGEDPISYGFEKRKGNCYVHALILKALLDEKGFESQLIWVTDHTHYWVVVNLDGVWKHIDATPSRGFHNKYSLMDDAQRLETLKGREWDREQWPACE